MALPSSSLKHLRRVRVKIHFVANLSSLSTDTEDATFSNYPSDISVNTDPSQATAVVSWVPPTVMDNSGDITVTSNYDPNDVFPIGGTVVTYGATDGSGNNVSYSFNITVNGQFILLLLSSHCIWFTFQILHPCLT